VEADVDLLSHKNPASKKEKKKKKSNEERKKKPRKLLELFYPCCSPYSTDESRSPDPKVLSRPFTF
jgi:hypothetical protein